MQKLTIDDEFKALLPELDKDTYALLEENLIENGCRDSLVVWNGVLIDGHNRYEICTKHDIPFNTVEKEFASREEALIWIITTQVSRRNLTPIQLSHFRGLHYMADKKIQGSSNQYVQKSESGHYDPFHFSTAQRLSTQYNVSPKTIRRDAKLAAAIDAIGVSSPEAKRMILSGEAKFDKKELRNLSEISKEDLSDIAAEIIEGTYEKQKPAFNAPSYGNETSDGVHARTRPYVATISSITDDFYSELRRYSKNGDKSELKTALRCYIDDLEDIYRQI